MYLRMMYSRKMPIFESTNAYGKRKYRLPERGRGRANGPLERSTYNRMAYLDIYIFILPIFVVAVVVTVVLEVS